METKWADLMSYGLTTALLKVVLPINESLQAVTVRNHLLKVAERVEQSLRNEQPLFFFESTNSDFKASGISVPGQIPRALGKYTHFRK